MKRLLLFTICLLCASSVYAIDISRLEPACWWVGMKNPELQIMVYGKNIASSQVYIDYPGVRKLLESRTLITCSFIWISPEMPLPVQ